MRRILKKLFSLAVMMPFETLRSDPKWFLEWWRQRNEIRSVRKRYLQLLPRLKKKTAKGERLKVLFLFCESSKWKCQSVYDRMSKSDVFDPYVCIVCADADHDLPESEFMERVTMYKEFCRSRNMRVLEAHGRGGVGGDLAQYDPDIVFYPLPWHLQPEHNPRVVSQFALTCYVPYFVPCRGPSNASSQLNFHRFLFRHFALNAFWVRIYNWNRFYLPIAGRIVATGHPMLDVFRGETVPADRDGGYVIYAPHWSITGCAFEQFSTFLEIGTDILRYAQRHPEVKWCFKPHPTLPNALMKFAHWTKDKVEAYYKEWDKIGVTCYDGSYPAYFKHSRCMITDSDSFLIEYACVNKPIIHMIRREADRKSALPNRKLFSSYYRIDYRDDFTRLFDEIIVKGADPKRAERERLVRALNLQGTDAAGNIVRHLTELVKGID